MVEELVFEPYGIELAFWWNGRLKETPLAMDKVADRIERQAGEKVVCVLCYASRSLLTDHQWLNSREFVAEDSKDVEREVGKVKALFEDGDTELVGMVLQVIGPETLAAVQE